MYNQTSILVFSLLSAQAISFRPLSGTVPWHKDVSETTWRKPDWPVNYVVPNFGVDSDIIATKKNIKSSEKRLKKKMHADFGATKAQVNPRGYKVPSFGVDQDIKNVK